MARRVAQVALQVRADPPDGEAGPRADAAADPDVDPPVAVRIGGCHARRGQAAVSPHAASQHVRSAAPPPAAYASQRGGPGRPRLVWINSTPAAAPGPYTAALAGPSTTSIDSTSSGLRSSSRSGPEATTPFDTGSKSSSV